MCEIIRGEISEGRNVPLDLKGAKCGTFNFFSQFLYFSSVL